MPHRVRKISSRFHNQDQLILDDTNEFGNHCHDILTTTSLMPTIIEQQVFKMLKIKGDQAKGRKGIDHSCLWIFQQTKFGPQTKASMILKEVKRVTAMN